MEPQNQAVPNPNVAPRPEVSAGVEAGISPQEMQPQPPVTETAAPVQASSVATPAVPAVDPDDIVQPPVAPAGVLAAPATSQLPAVASDVDVLEKEWVDHAQEIIKKTQDDPYREEEAVESLQRDYLKKRYGHDVGKPNG